jgi:hypothetical protein
LQPLRSEASKLADGVESRVHVQLRNLETLSGVGSFARPLLEQRAANADSWPLSRPRTAVAGPSHSSVDDIDRRFGFDVAQSIRKVELM